MKKILSVIIAMCIILSTIPSVAAAVCIHKDFDGDSICDLCDVQLVAKVTYDKRVTYYDVVNDAFSYADGKTDTTIDLLANCDVGAGTSSNMEPVALNKGGNIILNLNGYLLSGKGYGMYGAISVYEGVNLTVEAGTTRYNYIDLSVNNLFETRGGSITINGGDFYVHYLVNTMNFFLGNFGGSFILNDVIISTSTTNYGVFYQYDGETVFNNCEISAIQDNPSIYYTAYGSVVINGGYYSCIAVDDRVNENITPFTLLGEGYDAYNKGAGKLITEATNHDLYYFQYISNVEVKKVIAIVNEVEFFNIYEALEYACSLESATLTLCDDVKLEYQLLFTGGNVTIDMNMNSFINISGGTPLYIQAGSHKIINANKLEFGDISNFDIILMDDAELKISQAQLPNGIRIYRNGYQDIKILDILEDECYFRNNAGWLNPVDLEDTVTIRESDGLRIEQLNRINLPTEFSVQAGQDEVLTYEITEDEAIGITYQWYVNDEAAEGETSSTLALKNFDCGTYKVYCVATVTSSADVTPAVFSSNICTLTVLPCDVHIENGMDGLCDVCKIQLEAKVNINGTVIGYTSVLDAFTAASGNTATVDLLSNSSIGKTSITLTSGDITLNLNGYMIESPEESLFKLKDSVKLTVDATGCEYSFSYDSNHILFDVLGGTLVLNGGSFNAIQPSYGFLVHAIVYNAGGNITVNNTVLSGYSSNGLVHQYRGNTVINNCTIVADEGEIAIKGYGDKEAGLLVINGGYYNNIYSGTETGRTALGLVGEDYYAVNNTTGERITEEKTFDDGWKNYYYIEDVLLVEKPTLRVNLYKDQIRFGQTSSGEYAGAFDYRTVFRIDGVDKLCDSVDDIIDISDGDGIIEAGYLFNNGNAIDINKAERQIKGGEKIYSQVNDAYISTTAVENAYTSACTVRDIPDADVTATLSTVYYVVFMEDGVVNYALCDIPHTTTFEGLYNTYFPMAFPNA